MRILVLTPTFLPAVGGAELVILQVYRRLAERHSILVLTPRLNERILQHSASNEYDSLINFRVERYTDKVTFFKIPGHRLSMGLLPPFSLTSVSQVGRVVREFRPQVLNVHYVMPTGLAGVYAEKTLGVPTVVTYNGRDVPGPGVPKMWKYWHRWVGRSCSGMTFVSKYCRDVIYGPHCEVGYVVFNGVDQPVESDPQKACELRTALNISPDAPVLFALQRLDYLKRVDIIIESLGHIVEKYPKAHLVIGGTGSDLPRLKSCVERLRLERYVTFAGYIRSDELPTYYSLADLFLFHSTYETFGMVLAEAMSYGKAVVSVNDSAVPEVVDHGRTGTLVPKLEPGAFAGAVIQLLENREMREEFGRRGRDKALSVFSWDRIAGQYEGVLDKLSARDTVGIP